MTRYILLLVYSMALQQLMAQSSLTLEQCQEKARQNFPLIRQKELIQLSKDYTIANAQSGYLPQVAINGQATYQSEVTRVPIDLPNLSIQPLSKDQYKIYAELNQTIYDGGTIRRNSGVQRANAQTEDQRVEVELFKVKDRINQVFFGILLIDRQVEQIELLKKDLSSSLKRTEAAIANGTSFRSNADILKAEILKANQRLIEMKSSRKAFTDMMGLYINQPLDESTVWVVPAEMILSGSEEIRRPEMQLFDFQKQQALSQYQLNNTRNMPRLAFFVQGGYGKPGLNALKNEFATYYIGGLRLSWNLGNMYNSKRDKELLNVNTNAVDVQRDLFLFTTRLTLQQQSSEVSKLDEMIKLDSEIVSLRTQIKETAKAQLDNGVITASDFLRELNAEDQARQNLLLHQVQRQLAKANYLTNTGN